MTEKETVKIIMTALFAHALITTNEFCLSNESDIECVVDGAEKIAEHIMAGYDLNEEE